MSPPVYHVYLQKNERFFLAAEKIKQSLSPNYNISINLSDFDKKSKNYIGKVKSNFYGTIFNIWDNGTKLEDIKSKNERIRQSKGCVTYVIKLNNIRKQMLSD